MFRMVNKYNTFIFSRQDFFIPLFHFLNQGIDRLLYFFERNKFFDEYDGSFRIDKNQERKRLDLVILHNLGISAD